MRRRWTGLRVATALACVLLVVAVGAVTSVLIREPAPARVAPIDLPAGSAPAATPTPTAFAPPPADDDPEDDPFDDDD